MKELDNYQHELKKSWDDLKEAGAKRKEDLEDALQAQQYLADANESQIWMEV